MEKHSGKKHRGIRVVLIAILAAGALFFGLFYVTDVLITDYSSNICEYSLMDRPMLFYGFDEEEYARERGFHRPYREFAPGKVCRSFEELMEAYRTGDFEQEKAQRYVREQFDYRDSGASDRVIDRILLGK